MGIMLPNETDLLRFLPNSCDLTLQSSIAQVIGHVRKSEVDGMSMQGAFGCQISSYNQDVVNAFQSNKEIRLYSIEIHNTNFNVDVPVVQHEITENEGYYDLIYYMLAQDLVTSLGSSYDRYIQALTSITDANLFQIMMAFGDGSKNFVFAVEGWIK